MSGSMWKWLNASKQYNLKLDGSKTIQQKDFKISNLSFFKTIEIIEFKNKLKDKFF